MQCFTADSVLSRCLIMINGCYCTFKYLCISKSKPLDFWARTVQMPSAQMFVRASRQQHLLHWRWMKTSERDLHQDENQVVGKGRDGYHHKRDGLEQISTKLKRMLSKDFVSLTRMHRVIRTQDVTWKKQPWYHVTTTKSAWHLHASIKTVDWVFFSKCEF